MGDPVTQACAQAVGSAVVPFSDAIKATYRTFKQQYDYVRKLERNFSLFEKAEQDLSDKEHDVRRVIALNAPRMETTAQAETWLKNVLAQTREIMLVKERYNARTKCLCGMCPFLSLRKLGKRVVRQTTRTRALLDEVPNNENNKIVIGREAERVQTTDSKKIDGLESLYENVEELLMNLDEPKKRWIGIWGDGGVGKTTILKRLIKELEDKPHMFDVVIMVEVGKEWSVSAIQEEIVARLKLNVEGIDTENQVARIISEVLAKRKYLLVLDEVFSELNLGDVGIHKNHRQGKLVMACRSKFVLDKMDLDDEIKVKGLSEHDGQVLFRELVGPATFDRPRIKPIAERVAKQCGCYPQVIKAMASYLKDERSEDVWENALLRLTSPTRHLLDEMDDLVNALGLVYDLKLKEDRKKCLKYGAIFPEDYEMYQDYLIECWKAQNCLENVETMKRAREEGHAVLKDLISYCLLEKGKSEEHVKMSTICRMMGRRKYQANELLVGENGGILEEEEKEQRNPSTEQWEQAKMISLISTNLQNRHLPASPKCLALSTLLLQKNENLNIIPSEFFKQMPQLNVLDLYGTGINSVPPSVSHLRNIKALYLNRCPLVVGLPDEIQKLDNLEVLDIRGTGIRSFRTEVGAMSSLRCLRVSFTCYISNLNHSVNQNQTIGRIRLLEEFVVDVDPICKELLNKIAMGAVGQEIVGNIAIEIASLTTLTSLCFYFPSLGCFETFITQSPLVNKFRSFQIQVGRYKEHQRLHRLDIAGCSARRHFRYLAGGYPSGPPPTSITKVLKNACSFELIDHRDIQSLTELNNDAMECLEVCIIEECDRMKTVLLGGGNQTDVPVLPYLEKLRLCGLQSLECIWMGPLVQGSLASLTTLTLSDCPKIVKILSWEMAKLLPELKHLRVENCPLLVQIIEADQKAQTTPPRTSSQNPPNQSTQTTPGDTPSQAPTNHSRHTNPNGTLSKAPPNQSPKTNHAGTLSQASPNQSTPTNQVGSSSLAPHMPSSHTNQASTSSQAPPNQSTQINQVNSLSQAPNNPSSHTNQLSTSSQAPPNQLTQINQIGSSSQAPPNRSTQISQVSSSSQSTANKLPQAAPTGDLKTKLKTLQLIRLPMLVSIYGAQTNQVSTSSQAPPVHILEWTCLKKLEISECVKLQNLSLTANNARWLRSIECDEGWWRGLHFHDNGLKSNLEQRCRFR